jgi:hypothetical protein
MVFDERDEGLLRHIQIGPMDAEQLRREFLRWPPDTLPDTFLFLGLDYEYNKEMAFDLQVLRQVGRDAASWQEKCRAEITSLLIS